MAQTSFFHGVTVTLVDTGPRPIAIQTSSIIGLVDLFTAGAGLRSANDPVLLTSYREAVAAFGADAPITQAARAIYEQSSAVIVAVGVEAGIDAAETTSAIIGGVDVNGARTGLQALLDGKSRYNAQPRLLIAPGHSSTQAVATAMDGVAAKLKAIAIVDGPNTDDEAAIAYAANFGSKRVYLVDPGVKFWDTIANGEAHAPASAYTAGLFAQTDARYGFWASPSNKEITGIVGTARPIEFLDGDDTRLARAARSAEMMEAGRAQLGEGLAQGRQAMQIGGAVAATAAAPTMVAANYQAIIRDIAIKGGIARTGEETELAESIRRDASANGMDRNALAEAVNQLVAGGMEIKDAAGFASLIAKFSVGQNAGASDVSAMVLALKQAGVTDAKAMEKALGNIAVAGDLGSFEAKDMARHFATLMPQMTGFGISGEAATVGLANMLQTQMKAAGSADEAANNLRNLFSKITAQDTRKRFEDQGIDYDGSMQAAIAKGYDPVSAFIGLIEQSMQRTDPEKAKQLAKIQEQIADTEDPAARQKMLDGYLAMAGLTEFIGDQQAKQAALAAIQNKKLNQENLKAIKSADGRRGGWRATRRRNRLFRGRQARRVARQVGARKRPQASHQAESVCSYHLSGRGGSPRAAGGARQRRSPPRCGWPHSPGHAICKAGRGHRYLCTPDITHGAG